MKIVPVCRESYGANTYILISGTDAFVVDPTVSVGAILNAVREEDAYLQGILLTHGHFDHLFSLDPLRNAVGVKAYIHENDAVMLTDGKKNAFYDFFRQERTYAPADVLLSDMDKIKIGDEEITVIHTPGHTSGSVCFFCDGILVSGDTLFAETYGRCDLYSGNQDAMSESLRRLSSLPRNTIIYPGHGGSTKLGNALDMVSYLL